MKPEHLDLLIDLLIEDRERAHDAGREQAAELAALRDLVDRAEREAARLRGVAEGLRLDLAYAEKLLDQRVAELAAALGELRALKAPASPVGP